MRFRLNRYVGFTEGERGLVIAAIGVAVFGATLSFSVVNRLGGTPEVIAISGYYDLWSILSGSIGALAALYLGRKSFGYPGRFGWARAFVGIGFVTFMAALIGGTIALPIFGTMFGPFALALTFFAHPGLLAFWVFILICTHLLAQNYRRERDSIFKLPNEDGVFI